MKKIDHILLVDDDDIANYLHQILLNEVAHEAKITVAHNGESAIDFIRKYFPEKTSPGENITMIFLDLHMPVMDGFEFLEELNKLDHIDLSTLPIVLLTSSTNKKDLERSMNYPIFDYVPKPLTQEKLQSLLNKVLSN